jgi:hypothetical protein
MGGHTGGESCVDRYVDVRHRRQIRAGVCLALPALVVALCAALGLTATTAAHAAAGGGHGKAAVAAAPQRPTYALARVQDPFGFDLVAGEQLSETSQATRETVPPAPPSHRDIEQGAEHNRGPPDGERS